jgi:hypothetical protein
MPFDFLNPERRNKFGFGRTKPVVRKVRPGLRFIRIIEPACSVARRYANKRYPENQAPTLPLQGCPEKECQCRLGCELSQRNGSDRRSGVDRRGAYRFALERRSGTDRRRSRNDRWKGYSKW